MKRSGRARRRRTQNAAVKAAIESFDSDGPVDAAPICPLCLRPIPDDVRSSLHHLTPVLKGGRGGPTVRLHQICHNEIHAALSEAALAREFNTVDALRNHPQIARFIAWVADKPPGFISRSYGNHRRRRK